MSELSTDAQEWAVDRHGSEGARRTSVLVRCLGAAGCVAVASLLAYVIEQLAPSPDPTLIFVLPVVVSATLLGWTASVVAVVLSVAAFDFFFTEPYFSLVIAKASDIWAATLLLVTATIVSVVAAEARRRAEEARRAAAQARALQGLAHVVIEGRSADEVAAAAAKALNEIFDAPTVVFADGPQGLRPVASAGGAVISGFEQEAADAVLRSNVPAPAEAYPYDRSQYDLWPLKTASGGGGVLGVDFKHARQERPAAPERFIEIVAAYLATSR